MQAVKALVVVMGVMIVAGVIGLGVVLAGRLSGAAAPPMAASLGQGEGARIVGIAAFGNRLAVHVAGAGPDRVLVVDPTTHRVIATLAVGAP